MPSPAFRIYNASAGSGKTFNLVKDYLMLLFQKQAHVSPERILAVTFTNKAAAEMKERVLEKLSRFAEGNLEAPAQEIMRELSLDEKNMAAKSKKLFDRLLFEYDHLQFGTIDRFTYRIIRTFARELGISLSADVEMNDRGVLMEIIDDFLLKIDEKSPYFRWFLRMLEDKMEENKHWDIAFDLKETLPWFILSDRHADLLEKLEKIEAETLHETGREIGRKTAQLKSQIRKQAEELLQIIRPWHKQISYYNRYESLLNKILNGHFKDLSGSSFDKLLSGEIFKKNAGVDEGLPGEISAKAAPLEPMIRELFELSVLRKGLNPLGVYSAVLQETREYKTQNDKIFISDFNKILRRVVKDSDAPFIYWRLGEKFKHFFIDEFQDTSVLQWENLVPLINDVLSRHTGYPYASLNLLGDPKQSIYRFRGGDPEQFIELAYFDKNPFVATGKEILKLNKNWRSAKSIVQFNNTVFPALAQAYLQTGNENLPLNQLYLSVYEAENVRQDYRGDAPEGYVEVDLAPVENETGYGEKILEKVNGLIGDGWKPGEICILADRHAQLNFLAHILAENGYKTLSENALQLKASAKLQLLHELFRYAVEPDEGRLPAILIWYAQIRNRPLEPDRILKLRGGTLEDILQALTGKKPENLPGIFRLHEFFLYLTGFLELDDENEQAQLRLFFDLVNRLSAYETTPVAYLHAWENRLGNESVLLPADDQSIKLMTVHKAKGLEFPVVIYAYATEAFNPQLKDMLWTKNTGAFSREIPYVPVRSSDLKRWSEIEPSKAPDYAKELLQVRFDALNRLYVALTRPKEQLYLMPYLKGKPRGFIPEFEELLQNSGAYDPERKIFLNGTPLSKTKEPTYGQTLRITSMYPALNLQQRLKINTKKIEYWSEERKKPVELGLKIHDYLASIRYQEDWPEIKTLILNKEKEFAKIIIQLIESILTHPQLKAYFMPPYEIFNERELFFHGEILRPDRFVRKPGSNQVILMDYKTGQPGEEHRRQVNQYAEALQAAGYETAEAFLIYLNTGIDPVKVVKTL